MALSDWFEGMGELLRAGLGLVLWSVQALGMLLVLMLLSVTVWLPWVATLMVSMAPGLLWIRPKTVTCTVVAVCLAVVTLVSVAYYGPSKGKVAAARDRVARAVPEVSKRHRLLGFLLAFPAGLTPLAAVCVPYVAAWTAVRWLGLWDGAARFSRTDTGVAVLAGAGFFWMTAMIGRPHRHFVKIPFLGPLLVRIQLGFTDTMEAYKAPRAAARDHARILRAAQDTDPGQAAREGKPPPPPSR